MQEPIRTIELYKTFATALIAWVVVMGYWPMDNMQQAVTLTMAIAGINLVGAYFQNRQTTPLKEPRDIDNVPLTRPDNSPALKEQDAIYKEFTRGLE